MYRRFVVSRVMRSSRFLTISVPHCRGRSIGSSLTTTRPFSVGGYLWDVVTTGNLNSVNPILAAIESEGDSQQINLAALRPHHLTKAATEVHKTFQTRLADLESQIAEDKSMSSSDLVSILDKINSPVRNAFHFAALFRQMYSLDSAWLKAANQAAQILSQTDMTSKVVLDALESFQALEEKDSPIGWALDHLVKTSKDQGVYLNEEDKVMFDRLKEAQQEMEPKFFSPEEVDPSAPSPSTREVIQDLYTVAAITSRQSRLLGYDNAVQLHLDGRQYSLEEINASHGEVSARVLEKIQNEPSSNLASLDDNDYTDLREYLTLDGTLGGMFALSRALFGVSVTEEKDAKGWHHDVRLFHVREEEDDQHIGSFFIDPYFRPTKTRQTLMGPVLEAPKLAFMASTIKPPVWDHLPTDMRLEDAISIFHEFGHVLQFLLARESGVRGATNITVDVSEVLPQFMEHWLFEADMLQTLAHFSQSPNIPDDVIEKIKKERILRKTRELLQRTFLGDLEIAFYSRKEDDDESLVALQHRIAMLHVDHDLPAKNDLSPLSTIVESNARGKRVAQYRYLISEMISADVFQHFQEGGVSNEAEVKRLGRRLRSLILEPGALLSSQAFKEFSGRDLSTKPLLQLYGM